jgi:hypothetical protein
MSATLVPVLNTESMEDTEREEGGREWACDEMSAMGRFCGSRCGFPRWRFGLVRGNLHPAKALDCINLMRQLDLGAFDMF